MFSVGETAGAWAQAIAANAAKPTKQSKSRMTTLTCDTGEALTVTKCEAGLPLARLQHRCGGNPRPGGDLVAERHIGRVHLGGTGALAGKFGKNVLGLAPRGADEIGREGAQLNIVLRGQRAERLNVEPLHLG